MVCAPVPTIDLCVGLVVEPSKHQVADVTYCVPQPVAEIKELGNHRTVSASDVSRQTRSLRSARDHRNPPQVLGFLPIQQQDGMNKGA